MRKDEVVLVTGATGYVGGRLVSRLVEDGRQVRVVVRSPRKLRDVPWAAQMEVVEGDLQDAGTMNRACEGVSTLYYLMHSMGSGRGFEECEAQIVGTVAGAAAQASVKRMVIGSGSASFEMIRHLADVPERRRGGNELGGRLAARRGRRSSALRPTVGRSHGVQGRADPPHKCTCLRSLEGDRGDRW